MESQRDDHEIGKGHTHHEKPRRDGQKRHDPSPLTRHQGRLEKSPEMVEDHRHGERNAAQQRHLDGGKNSLGGGIEDEIVGVWYFEPGDHRIGVRECDHARHQKGRPAPVEPPLEIGNMTL